MNDRPFVHLHCHSHYSLLDGAGSLDKLIGRVKELGMNALALTDHGNLHGALAFYRKAKAAGINPILGYEAYIAPESRRSKDAGNMKEASYHLTLLAKNRTGFQNLMEIASLAYLEGFYFKPRIDKELLAEHNEGIICLSGCLSSELNRTLLKAGSGEEGLQRAIEIAQWFQGVFGERYFIEIMNNGLDIQQQVLKAGVEVAGRLGIPTVATSDVHYVRREDAEAQDVMLCINTGKFRTDANRMKMDGDEYFIRSPEEMYAAFPALEDSVSRSQQIADGVDINLDLGKRHFPTFTLPKDKTADELLRELCIQGLQERYAEKPRMCADGELTELVMARLNRELKVIGDLGFPNYFLIVWDFVRHARELGIPTTARGSGVGAIVCYALYMSHVCPIEYDLLFERFLDPNREEAPDIDIDFCKERRTEIMQYVKEKYGEKNVAQIGTFGTLAARASIRDVGRVLSVSLGRVNQIIAMVPDQLGIKLAEAIETSEDLKKTYETDGEIREVLDLAMKVEGLARNVGTHAAAVVIADTSLTQYVPLGRVTGKTDIITQWAMGDVEAAGLLKMDFLGLRNLTILSKVVDLIEQTTGKRIDPHKFPLDDKETFALFCRGETKGVFQLESGGIRDLLQKMKPDHFHDIIATNALYRPGPLEGGMVEEYVDVKHGRKKPEYKHAVLEEILAETNGVMVYQEQVMRILNRLGGIPLASAYTCIKAISKKKESLINKNREQFLLGAVEKGLKQREAEEFWVLITKFAGYGFNKSHSTAYALIAYQTAYLKAHYPIEFMAALLTGDIPGRNFQQKDSLVEHLDDCERMNVEIVPPDVNTSDEEFAVADGKVFFALMAIKGCSKTGAKAIVEARRKHGRFRDIFDLCERVDSSACKRSTLETLIKAGAMDSFGARRAQLLAVVERAVQAGAAALADKRSGQKSLFGAFEDEEEKAEQTSAALPDVPDLAEREQLLMEKEVLGFYLSSHPLAEHQQTFDTYCSHTTADVASLPDKAEVTLGGMLSSIKLAHVRKVRPGSTATKYANFDLEDINGSIRCILWPEDFAKQGDFVRPDAVLVVSGRIDRRGGDEANLIVNELIPLEKLESRYTRGVMIRVIQSPESGKTLSSLREILRCYPGQRELQLLLCLDDGSRVYLRSEGMRVDVNPEMRTRVDGLLGAGNFRLLTAEQKV